MKRILAILLAAAIVGPLSAGQAMAAKDQSLQGSDYSAAKKKKKKSAHYYYRAPGYPARGAFGQYRSDPSFDPYGRPWRPNFYAPCTEDLGYGRFKSCDNF